MPQPADMTSIEPEPPEEIIDLVWPDNASGYRRKKWKLWLENPA